MPRLPDQDWRTVLALAIGGAIVIVVFFGVMILGANALYPIISGR